MVFQGGVVRGDLVKEDLSVQWIFVRPIFVFLKGDLLTNSLLKCSVFFLLVDKFVEFNWLIELVFGESLRWLVESRFLDFVHHLSVLG